MALEMRKMETLRVGYHRSRQNEDQKSRAFTRDRNGRIFLLIKRRQRDLACLERLRSAFRTAECRDSVVTAAPCLDEGYVDCVHQRYWPRQLRQRSVGYWAQRDQPLLVAGQEGQPKCIRTIHFPFVARVVHQSLFAGPLPILGFVLPPPWTLLFF